MRIGIVNDVAMIVEALRRIVASVPEYRIAWVARDGVQAVALAAADTPDLILMDLEMPIMDGVEATRKIMHASPCAILVVTATVDGNVSHVFNALGAGALDAVSTPIMAGSAQPAGDNPLLMKLRVMRRLIGGAKPEMMPPLELTAGQPLSDRARAKRLILIGSSAGGPPALAKILQQVASDSPPVVVIQHIDGEFAAGMAQWLAGQTKTNVRLAREGDLLSAGTIYLAGTDNHLIFTGSETLGYTAEPKNSIYRPSIDTCFLSVLAHVRGRVAAAILTGMGHDGAEGLKALRRAGAYTVAQDRETSAVYGMPKAAAEIDAAEAILPLSDIMPAMLKYLDQKSNHVRTP